MVRYSSEEDCTIPSNLNLKSPSELSRLDLRVLVQIDEEQMVMLGGSAATASHALLYNLTSGQSSR